MSYFENFFFIISTCHKIDKKQFLVCQSLNVYPRTMVLQYFNLMKPKPLIPDRANQYNHNLKFKIIKFDII